MDQVHRQVYISNISDAREKPTPNGVSAVITVCQDYVGDNIGVEYHHYNMSDGPENSYGGDSSYELFEEAAEQILDYLTNDQSVLVHCHMGRSRSVSTSTAALGVYENRRYDDVYNMIERVRPQIHPDGLLEQHAKQFIEERTDINHEPFTDD